jgi:hypothetical protein
MQMGHIAYVTSQRAFSRKEEAGQDSEFDENAEILVGKAGLDNVEDRSGCGERLLYYP